MEGGEGDVHGMRREGDVRKGREGCARDVRGCARDVRGCEGDARDVEGARRIRTWVRRDGDVTGMRQGT